MKKNVQTLIFFVVVTLISCETVIEMKLPEQPPKIVLNSFFNPDSIIMLHLSKSQFVLNSQEIKPITDADVTLYENGSYIGRFTHINKGFYSLHGFYPKIGAQYTVNVSANGLKSVEAKDIIPFKPIIDRVEISSSFYEGQNYKDFIIYIKDNANEENYYTLDLFGKRFEYIYDTITYNVADSFVVTERIYYTSQDLVFQDQGAGPQAIISDNIFNGNTYPLRLSVTEFLFDEFNSYSYFEVIVQLNQVSKAYAQYTLTLSKNRYSDPFSQPVQVFSNVTNGFGVFAGYSSTHTMINVR